MLLFCPGTYVRRRQTIVLGQSSIFWGHRALFCFLFAYEAYAILPYSAPANNSITGYSGIFPCFLGGFLSRLVPSISSAWISLLRVSRGWMTASTNPRSAAT